ncbi:MAG: hypothetical protein PVI71_16965 [Desulfobacterales bacterium]|jgi:hypothetical protein
MRKIIKSFYWLVDNFLTAALLKRIKPVDIHNSEYIFIFSHVKSNYSGKLYTLLLHEFSKQGVASYFLFKNNLLSSYYPRFDIDGHKISNAFTVEKKKRLIKSSDGQRLFFEWAVDIENKKIEAKGINFFPIVTNTLRAIQKRYNVFYNDENNKPVYSDLIQSCDLLLKYFLLLKDYANKTNKKIRLVGWEISYIPNGVFRMLCDQLTYNRDIEFIELDRGNIGYFGQYHFRESYISTVNHTRTKSSFGWAVSKEELAEVDDKEIELDELLKPVSKALEKDIYDKIPDNQKTVMKTLEEYQSKEKKIFVLFAHLFYDTPLDDESAAFNGMCEWIKETIKYFNGKENLLLIKPHPSELRKDEPKKKPNETLASFLRDAQLSDNIIILEPRVFTVKDLSPFMSCGLIWRSSVAMELTFLGIPCIIAGNPYYSVLDLNIVKDREQYFDMIKRSHEINVPEKLKVDIAKYLYLLEKKHAYVDCISYDVKRRKIHWNRKALKSYLKSGNQTVNSIVDNMLE